MKWRQLLLELLPMAENRGEIPWLLLFFCSTNSCQDLSLAEPRWTPADMGDLGYSYCKCQPLTVEQSKENQRTNMRANRLGWIDTQWNSRDITIKSGSKQVALSSLFNIWIKNRAGNRNKSYNHWKGECKNYYYMWIVWLKTQKKN